ncbi:shikimate dehydrogenase [Methyloceanibacter superfactus]|uniref:Shikimate dehydrogenase (NADP(+)) n=1 Tax=Methyloceanibacter superfactus TaxID=1774969 RepID=A0A1E3VUV1_9HYPH|nr:shikimate dehydrogenase [Methyloceanibacter superfactus]ODR97330.1 shikimate dehydrogenase [Methyloceanibacter superfactus]
MLRACVIGWPVEHSRSPIIHGYWLAAYGIDGAYEKEAVRPEDFAAFVQTLGERGYVGANVTLPHKEAALRAARSTDAAAIAMGAANTLWLDAEGVLHAANTDATASPISTPKRRNGTRGWARSLVLGAGGAARAILYGLLAAGVPKILLANRTRARADSLAKLFGPKVEAIDWEEREPALAGCSLLVNTTSLGMTGQGPLVIDLSALPPDAVVSDLVYNPLETDLLAAARARGLTAVDGLGMLLHQAVPGFERWFGLRPEVSPDLRARVAATLEAS